MNEPSSSLERRTFRQRCAAELKSKRETAALSQESLAERAGFHRSYVSQVERAVQNMSLDNLERLHLALNLTQLSGEIKSLRMRFAANMKRERVSQGLSQEKLAELAGLHRTYVSQVERGVTSISLDNVEKLAAALGRDEESLLDTHMNV
ncbi:anaerobic benzoate catabolism transcriptional regulator [compost metagenome]